MICALSYVGPRNHRTLLHGCIGGATGLDSQSRATCMRAAHVGCEAGEGEPGARTVLFFGWLIQAEAAGVLAARRLPISCSLAGQLSRAVKDERAGLLWPFPEELPPAASSSKIEHPPPTSRQQAK